MLLARFLNNLCFLWYLLLFARVALTWFNLSPYSPAARALHTLTEPVLAPLRRLLDPYQRGSSLDFSPMLAVLLVEIVRRFLVAMLVRGTTL